MVKVWRGCLLLAEHILSREEEFRGVHGLELGAGVGLSGMVLARTAQRVWLTGMLPGTPHTHTTHTNKQTRGERERERERCMGLP